MAEAIIKASADGVLSTEKRHDLGDKLSDGQPKLADDSEKIYRRYVKTESKKTSEHTEGGKKANVSKMRKLIEFGNHSAGGAIDPVEVYNRAMTLREHEKRTAKEDGPKLKSQYPFVVDLAREQLKVETPLSDDELRGLVYKPLPPEKELTEELRKIADRLQSIYTGENKAGLKDQSEEIETAYHAILGRFKALGGVIKEPAPAEEQEEETEEQETETEQPESEETEVEETEVEDEQE
jgi:hypothetical protein